MSIVDQYGYPARMRFARAINSSAYQGPVFRRSDDSIHRLIPSSDRKALAALSRRVVFNAGIAKECIRQKAAFTVGGAFLPTYSGEDSDAGAEAVTYLEDTFFPRLELCGGCFEWQDFLEMLSKSIDRDGEAFVMLTHHEDGAPALLAIPAFMVRSKDEIGAEKKGGENDGARVEDGLGIDPTSGRVLFYRVFSSETESKDVPAGEMIHLFERDFPEQRRGFPAFAASLSDILNGMESKQLEILRQLIVSNVFLMDKGGDAPRATEAGFELVTNTATGESVISEQVAPGIRYLKSGQELQALKHDNPGSIWESFQSRLWDEAVIGAGWSASMVRAGAGGNTQGTVERADVERARRSIKSRARTLKKGARAFVTWGLTADDAPAVQRFSGWGFSDPARLSVDDGREAKSILEAVKAQAMPIAAYAAYHGMTRRELMVGLAQDRLEAAAIAAEMSRDGVEISPEDLLIRDKAPSPDGETPQNQPEIPVIQPENQP